MVHDSSSGSTLTPTSWICVFPAQNLLGVILGRQGLAPLPVFGPSFPCWFSCQQTSSHFPSFRSWLTSVLADSQLLPLPHFGDNFGSMEISLVLIQWFFREG